MEDALSARAEIRVRFWKERLWEHRQHKECYILGDELLMLSRSRCDNIHGTVNYDSSQCRRVT